MLWTLIQVFIREYDKFDYQPNSIQPEKERKSPLEQARTFLKNEKVFGLELYAILGFFERKMRDMSSFMNSLGNMKSAFQPTGEIVNMLMTSKRFTDQLDDILIDRDQFGHETLR